VRSYILLATVHSKVTDSGTASDIVAHAGNSSDGLRKANKSANGEKNAKKACFIMKNGYESNRFWLPHASSLKER